MFSCLVTISPDLNVELWILVVLIPERMIERIELWNSRHNTNFQIGPVQLSYFADSNSKFHRH